MQHKPCPADHLIDQPAFCHLSRAASGVAISEPSLRPVARAAIDRLR